ncbi:hypothetical protein [Coleofasciculus chthonoplastes]|uniref:hypothetical protein n=1 Tax=Coleofasciculus chthonoplastes TaxID=64178 RepID=UPI0032F9B425
MIRTEAAPLAFVSPGNPWLLDFASHSPLVYPPSLWNTPLFPVAETISGWAWVESKNALL